MWNSPSQQLAEVSGLPPLVILHRGVVSDAPSLDFTSLPDGYRDFRLVFDNLIPATNGNLFQLRVSDDNGATWDAGTDYDYVEAQERVNVATTAINPFLNQDHLAVAGSGNILHAPSAANTASGEIIMRAMKDGVQNTRMRAFTEYFDVSVHLNMSRSAGRRRVAQLDNAFQLLFSSGNISSMNWTLYGMRAS